MRKTPVTMSNPGGDVGLLHERWNTQEDQVYNMGGVNWQSQSFTVAVGDSHYVRSVKLLLNRNGPDNLGTLTASIKAVDGNSRPTGVAKASGTYSTTLTSSPAWIEFQFIGGAWLTAGVEYCIELKAPACDYPTSKVQISNDASGGYANGRQAVSVNSGGAWLDYGTTNMFEEWS